MADIWAIILAGGESKRMKSPKMLLPFNGRTILEEVIENVSASEVDEIIVVLGAVRNEIIEVIKKYHVTHCYNDNYKDGMLSSVICGFRSLPADFGAALIFQGDQPMIRSVVVNKVINAYRKSGKGIVLPVSENKRGHPLLVDRKYRAEIERLNAEEGLRSLSGKFYTDVLEVNVHSQEILRDIDNYDDYLYETHMIDPNHKPQRK
ncbi:MAG: hypothetical protein C0408_05515 [Odoribacter sp.]|nr:hypothetical protein [Odoribacter sp.]